MLLCLCGGILVALQLNSKLVFRQELSHTRTHTKIKIYCEEGKTFMHAHSNVPAS